VRTHEIRPIWSSSTFLVYTGGLTVLGGAFAALGYLSSQYSGKGQGTAWSLLILVILYGIAHGLRIRERPIAAGIFAFASVIAWAIFVGVLFSWWGWTNGSFGSFRHWSWSRLAFELLVLAAAWDDRRRFRFPFIRLITVVVGWVFVIDLITSGGNFTLAVSLVVGLAYLAWGTIHPIPSSFWLHLAAGLLVGVPIIVWCHTTTFDFVVIGFMSLVYVAWAHATRRSSWAVYGTIGFFIVTVHAIVGSPTAIAEQAFGGAVCTATAAGENCTSQGGTSISAWSPALAFGLLGFWLVFLGILGRSGFGRGAAPPPAVPPPAVPPPA
jgi:hypothetical protein